VPISAVIPNVHVQRNEPIGTVMALWLPEKFSSKEDISPLNPRNVNFMERFAIKDRIATAEYAKKKWLHLRRLSGRLGCKRS